MANLTGFNIGANQRGILNIGSTINSPLSGTLQAVTDGMGVASPLQLSTTDLSVVQGVVSRLLISTDITMRRNDNTLFFQYSNAPDVLELNGNTIRLNNLRGSTAIGHSVAAARLHVRGDGTNPIARFEQLGGTATVILTAGGQLSLGNVAGTNPVLYPYASSLVSVDTSGENLGFYSYKTSSTTSYDFSFQGNNISITSGTRNVLSIIRTFAAGAGSGIFRPLNLEYTINNSGAQTGTATGIFLNATETALNGMTHNLMDLQVGGNSRFRVGAQGNVTSSGSIGLFNYSGYFQFISAGGALISAGTYESVTAWTIDGGGAFLLRLRNSGVERLTVNNVGTIAWGTTNAFPALKRNGAQLEVRLADDSGFADLRAANVNGNGIVCLSSGGVGLSQMSNLSTYGFHMSRNFVVSWGSNTQLDGSLDTAIARYSANVVRISNASTGAGNLFIGGTTGYNSSAILQADSTTQGFLPPRGSNAQMLAIATPATGLVFYDTTNNKLNVYDGTNWVAMH